MGQNVDIDKFFAGADDAPGAKLPFLPVADRHRVRLIEFAPFMGKKQPPRPGVRMTVEIVTTTSKETSPGMRHAIVNQQDTGFNKFWLGETLDLVAAAVNLPRHKVTEATLKQVVKDIEADSEDKILGLEFDVNVRAETSSKGKSFNKNYYLPATETPVESEQKAA